MNISEKASEMEEMLAELNSEKQNIRSENECRYVKNKGVQQNMQNSKKS